MERISYYIKELIRCRGGNEYLEGRREAEKEIWADCEWQYESAYRSKIIKAVSQYLWYALPTFPARIHSTDPLADHPLSANHQS